MTSQQVLDALITALHMIEPNVRMYIEPIAQGFQRPCFFMDIRQKDFPLMDRRFRREFFVSLQFFPEQGDAMREKAQRMADRLAVFLEWVEMENRPRRYFTCQSETEKDGTLKFDCTYMCYLMKYEPTEKMQNLKKNIETHGAS